MTYPDYLEALLHLPRPLAVMVSKDQKWVAWSWSGIAENYEVFVAPTDGSAEPLRLTNTPELTIMGNWSPDSKAVLVKQDHDGDERTCIYRVALDAPLEMIPLIDEHPNFFLSGGSLHPDSPYLVYGANVDIGSGEEIEQTVVIRKHLQTGEQMELARPQSSGWNSPILSPDGQWVIFQDHKHPDGVQIWLVDIDGQNMREVVNVGDDKKAWATFTPDSKRLIITAESATHDRVGIMALDAEQITWLIDDPDRSVSDAYMPHGTDQIVITEERAVRTISTLLNPDTGEEIPFPTFAGTLTPVAPVGDGDWIGVYYSSTYPHDIVRFSMTAQSPDDFTSITRVWDRVDLVADDLCPAEDFRWQSTDGLEIQGWLYRMKETPRGTIVYVHGGPTAHMRDMISAEIQYYVSQGFNVLAPNYRGSTGFGLPYRESIKQTYWGGMEQVDIRTGIEALIEQGIAQPGFVGMTGTSYGGYSSWHGITHFPTDILSASAPVCGMTDLVVDYQTTRPDLRPYSEEMLGGSPDENPDIYYERSPIHFVQQIKGRLLIVQGMKDPNVHPDNVRDVRIKLDEAGIEYGVIAFDDEGHGIHKKQNQRKLYPQLVDFFADAFANPT